MKCGFCKEKGHNIRSCYSDECNQLLDSVLTIAVRCMESYDLPINRRSLRFYDYLMTCKPIELKMILTMLKRQHVIPNRSGYNHGVRMLQMSSYIVKEYFYNILLLQENQYLDSVSENELRIIMLYVDFWNEASCKGYIRCINESVINLIIRQRIVEIRARRNNDSSQSNFKLNFQVSLNPVIPIDETFECSICMEDQCDASEKTTLICKHSFCQSCLVQQMNSAKAKRSQPCCALCRNNCSEIQVNSQTVLQAFQAMRV
jgi:hypothetical protein